MFGGVTLPRHVASVRGQHVSFQVSDLYERGVPLNEAEHVFETTTEQGDFAFMVIPGHASISVVTTWRKPHSGWHEAEKLERSIPLVWAPWGFGGHRPFAICWCGKRLSRAFIVTEPPDHGRLACPRCAGVRYTSQDSFHESAWLDVLVDAEDVLRVVRRLHACQPRVVVPVARADAVGAVVHHHVHVATRHRMRLDRL